MAVYFSIFLVILSGVTGIVWLLDKYYWAPQRQLNLADVQGKCEEPLTQEAVDKITEAPAMIDTAVQIFPVIAIITVLRSFIYEPFQIPSGSMMPTLLDGDFILVNKFNYGLRDPVMRNKFVENGLPERGDVVVFKYPLDERIDYIKRVIGVPGDRVIYKNKTLYVKPACTEAHDACPEYTAITADFKSVGDYSDIIDGREIGLTRYSVKTGEKNHDILVNDQIRPRVAAYFQQQGTGSNEFVVPKGQYFVMGDNRDNSLDGRFWGFVPEENLVGEAVAIWMSFDFERTEDSILPTWIPTGVRFNRIGGIE